MNIEKIKEIIRNGENSYVEFKESLSKDIELEKEIVALLNLRGGKILIGVSDDGRVKGVEEKELKNIEQSIMNICRDVIKPEIIPIYEKVLIDGKFIVILEVNGIDKPYYVYRNNRKTYYIRVGTTVREATRDELRRLFQASGMIHYDENPVYNSSIEDLSADKITEYFEKFREIEFRDRSEEEKINILLNSKILTQCEDRIVCTVAGVLLFGNQPSKFLSQSGIMFAHFKGTEISGELIDRKEINKTIIESIKEACEIIRLNILKSSKIEGIERIEKEIIPERVMREAIVNACIHRDYTIYGANIRIFMFDDRLEIRSPGTLPNTINIENMKIGVSVRRNPIIAQFVSDYRLAERTGRGVPMIIKEMRKITGREPKIEIVGEEVILTIYFPEK